MLADLQPALLKGHKGAMPQHIFDIYLCTDGSSASTPPLQHVSVITDLVVGVAVALWSTVFCSVIAVKVFGSIFKSVPDFRNIVILPMFFILPAPQIDNR